MIGVFEVVEDRRVRGLRRSPGLIMKQSSELQ